MSHTDWMNPWRDIQSQWYFTTAESAFFNCFGSTLKGHNLTGISAIHFIHKSFWISFRALFQPQDPVSQINKTAKIRSSSSESMVKSLCVKWTYWNSVRTWKFQNAPNLIIDLFHISLMRAKGPVELMHRVKIAHLFLSNAYLCSSTYGCQRFFSKPTSTHEEKGRFNWSLFFVSADLEISLIHSI